jgi:hypothetical protein
MSISLECVDRERSPAPFSLGRPRPKTLVVKGEALIALDLQHRLENSLSENLFSAQPPTIGIRLVQALTAQLEVIFRLARHRNSQSLFPQVLPTE